MIPIRDDNPTWHPSFVTIALIAINALVFFVELGQGQNFQTFLWKYGFVPAEFFDSKDELRTSMIEKAPSGRITDGRGHFLVDGFGQPILRRVELPYNDTIAIPPWINLITCMFLHGGWMHLIGNMVFLWVFGNNIEDKLGPALFLFFYLASGIAGSLAHAYVDPGVVPLVGASGAISGVLGGYILLFPHARVLAVVPLGWYWFTIKLPAWAFLGVYYLSQNIFGALRGSFMGDDSNVAYLAHLGGFAVGAGLIFLLPHRKTPAVRPVYRPIDDKDADLII
ncbi:MAG: rhomboid family intramembrane serine protease [Planctomycetes bacterium]|nr:rhomboid family intramembrane serine protease [Planctomycetota bacterium]